MQQAAQWTWMQHVDWPAHADGTKKNAFEMTRSECDRAEQILKGQR